MTDFALAAYSAALFLMTLSTLTVIGSEKPGRDRVAITVMNLLITGALVLAVVRT